MKKPEDGSNGGWVRDHSWRDKSPTDKQVDYLIINHLPVPETRGEANDIIYNHYRTQNAYKTTAHTNRNGKVSVATEEQPQCGRSAFDEEGQEDQ